MTTYAGKRVTVMGLGRFGGGAAAVRFLVREGARVTLTDAADAAELGDALGTIPTGDVTLKLGGHDVGDFTGTDLVVANPAVPPTSEFLAAAREAGVEVTTEIVLGVRRLRSSLTLGVTGTKGKSTTATLLQKMLTVAAVPGRPEPKLRPGKLRASFDRGKARGVWLCGNIGDPLLDHVDAIGEDDLVVLELSSYMLHYLGVETWSPHVAVVTMVGSDHLAWHGSQEAYLNDKRNLVRFQRENDFAVVPTGSKLARDFKSYTPARVVEYGKRANLPEKIAPRLVGKHNRLNERAAFAAAKLFGVYPDEAEQAVGDFAGLPHRLELVAEAGGVAWVNDSIATIPDAAAAACEAFGGGRVIQIVGGRSKGLDDDAMCQTLAERCKAVLCVGEVAERLALKIGGVARLPGTLDEAVTLAADLAEDGDVVLLSPGFPSYDQHANFADRGRAFADLARAAAGRA